LSEIADESKDYLDKAGITTACLRIKSIWQAGGGIRDSSVTDFRRVLFRSHQRLGELVVELGVLAVALHVGGEHVQRGDLGTRAKIGRASSREGIEGITTACLRIK